MAAASVHVEELSRRQAVRRRDDDAGRARAAQFAAVARLSHAALAQVGIDDLIRDGVCAITEGVPGAEVGVMAASSAPRPGPGTAVIPLGSRHGSEGQVLAVRTSGPLSPDQRAFTESVATVLVAAMARARTDELEEEARRSQRLAAAGQLAAGVAHDVNNIVTVIKLYAELLESESALDERALERLHAIRVQADRAVSLAWQVLDTAHREPLVLIDVDLVPFLDEFADVIGRLLPPGVSLAVRHQHRRHVVSGDPTRLQQVMTNLVANAGQALAGGGTLTIAVSSQADAAADGGAAAMRWVRVDVADTGDGIAPDVLPRVFEPFFSTKAAGKGSGLGLAQVHALVAQHGGHVAIRSSPGGGTVVSVWLPAPTTDDRANGRLAASQPGSASIGAQQSTNRLVLVVEDDPVLRAALVDSLLALGYRAEAVADGEDALVWLGEAASAVDAVVSDVAMAGLGGEGLARRMAAAFPDVPVVLTTSGPGLPADVPDGAGSGRVYRLAKPFSVDQLAIALGAALG